MAVIESSIENQKYDIFLLYNDIPVIIMLYDCVFSFLFDTYAGVINPEIICHIWIIIIRGSVILSRFYGN